ncbi:alkanesulfonate monooxygenase SsuD/methylene tetrahydromethanopterin reductase-like flavin-dependent oxidoreductase (luciferase family) [Nocardia kruczakiae]|uniref:Alkanesulfonate monooxygenase SsuD/methylene tetrahydromethanopterin reductase-like flavin-dependent oxidoreductase (Luciferase family) n=1 Tax=Nocardia kruczakiae TaxID=261477 RepID=A0ABU1XQW5_9NOCA|nr:LLM class flavin-dependent oxidoreductase [Nocardia kruczakiae]MDR7172929.1 alkanesulfonate monooxygenase SsuD/methylene tetrahydromethanopterin reductase-like flavin-dependent oxidoreductase (luciferase family) [Nocardia kruczakiae]
MVKSWAFDIFNYPYDTRPERFDPAAAQELYDWHLESWVKAEEQGYEGVLFSEHHFTAYNVSPSPNLLIAALAQRTSTLRMGVMGSILPFHNPRRVAEEVAMLDYLTHGRLEVGLGRGVDEQEFAKEKIRMEDTREYFLEALSLIEKAWRQPVFTHHGKFFHYDDTTIYPRPLQQPTPPVWMLSLSPATLEMAGQRGYKATSAYMPVAETAQAFETFRNAARRAGQPCGPDMVAVLRPTFVAETEEEARRVGEPALNHLFGLFKDAAVFHDLDNVPEGYEFYSSFFRPFVGQGDLSWDGLREAGVIFVGTPERVRDQIIDQAKALNCGNFFVWHSFGDLTAEQTMRSYELYAQTVIPALRELDLENVPVGQ